MVAFGPWPGLWLVGWLSDDGVDATRVEVARGASFRAALAWLFGFDFDNSQPCRLTLTSQC